MKAVGGQAVIEGVMMRRGNKIAIAVRKGKKIIVKKEKVKTITEKRPWSFPVMRGALSLFETMAVGMKTLNWSANIAAGEEEEEQNKWIFAVTAVAATALAILIFKFLPLGIAQVFSRINALSNRLAYNLVEGVSKIAVFTLYIYAIGKMKDVKRLFRYHGAEHKAVNCYEAKKPLTVKNVMKFSTIHPRCGTSFILFVIIISIIVYIFVPMDFSFGLKLLARILLLLPIAGISYEVLKLSAKHGDNILLKAVMKPGLALQKLTTAEPNKRQMEVSIKALKEVIKK
ncbi:MAG: DUF1385 domain-containing protein [Nanoarchaeota archaeon]|nr:DUF1385 domain-containing protein [Nanoarchaeota archaeon]